MRDGSSEAPITATELGLSNLAIRERSFGRTRAVGAPEGAVLLLAVLMFGLSVVMVLSSLLSWFFQILQLH